MTKRGALRSCFMTSPSDDQLQALCSDKTANTTTHVFTVSSFVNGGGSSHDVTPHTGGGGSQVDAARAHACTTVQANGIKDSLVHQSDR